MPLLSDEGADFAAVHLLLLANTKMGKSRYVAKAILDGYPCIYIDADNGKGTLLEVINGDKAALGRTLHIPTSKPYEFLREFVTARGTMRWNKTLDIPYTRVTCQPEHEVIELDVGRIAPSTILAVDSWTAVAEDSLRVSAKAYDVELDTMREQQSMGVRGQGGTRCNRILSGLQKAPFHVIVQGHTAFYERQEKPTGVAKEAKMGDMIVKENITIPYSVSKPHGHGMGKYFNEIGWLNIDRSRKIVLDFQKLPDRIGGGRKDSSGDPDGLFSFAKLYGAIDSNSAQNLGDIYRERTGADIQAALETAKPTPTPVAKPAPTVELPAGNKPSGLAGLMMKKK